MKSFLRGLLAARRIAPAGMLSMTAAIFAILEPTSVAIAAVNKVQGIIQDVPAITTFETYGGAPEANNMEGIEVTVSFSGGTSETQTWTGAGFADPGGGVAGADGDWSLRNLTTVPFNHTFANPWELTYVAGGGSKGSLVSFEIDGFGKLKNTGQIVGNTAFDTTFNPFPGTPDSAAGNTFNVIGNTHATTATYSDAIKLQSAAAPVGDLYRRLKVDFAGKVDTKWSQRPGDDLGVNIHSDLDYRLATTPNGDLQAAADDFISDGRPITGVRWWGSYFNQDDQPKIDDVTGALVPPVEDGFLISFFERSSATGGPGPGSLLGTYLAPEGAVDIQPTALVGADGHNVWEYVVDLDQALLEHETDLARPDAFHEEAGVEYWISIAAENAGEIDPDTGKVDINDDERRDEPWWGWHTTPEVGDNDAFVDDAIFAARVAMDGDQWVYAPWTNDLGEDNFAFELLTVDPNSIGLDGIASTTMSFAADTDTVVGVPEPSTALLLAIAGIAWFGARRRHAA